MGWDWLLAVVTDINNLAFPEVALREKQREAERNEYIPKLSFRYYSQRSQKAVEATERKRMDIFKKEKVEENR